MDTSQKRMPKWQKKRKEKNCWTSLVSKEMQLSQIRCHSPERLRWKKLKSQQACRTLRTPIYWEVSKVAPLENWGSNNQSWTSAHLMIHQLLGIYPTEMHVHIHQKTCTRMFISNTVHNSPKLETTQTPIRINAL